MVFQFIIVGDDVQWIPPTHRVMGENHSFCKSSLNS